MTRRPTIVAVGEATSVSRSSLQSEVGEIGA